MRFEQLDAAIEDLRLALPTDIGPDEIAMWADTSTAVKARAKTLNELASWIDQVCYEAVPPGESVVSEERTFRRTGKPTRKQWQTDVLLHAVFDSRLVDAETGEIADESPADKILHCWNLGPPRVTALEARGLDADDFSVTEWSGRAVKEVGT